METKIIHGRNLVVRFGGSHIAVCRSCEVVVQCDVIETSSPASGKSKEFVPGRISWEVKTSQLLKDIQGIFKVGTKSSLRFEHILPSPGGTKVIIEEMRGDAICTECNITATIGNLAQGSFKFQGSGEFKKFSQEI